MISSSKLSIKEETYSIVKGTMLHVLSESTNHLGFGALIQWPFKNFLRICKQEIVKLQLRFCLAAEFHSSSFFRDYLVSCNKMKVWLSVSFR